MSEVEKLGDIASYINGYLFKPEERGTVKQRINGLHKPVI